MYRLAGFKSVGGRCYSGKRRVAQGAVVPQRDGQAWRPRVIYYNTLHEGYIWLLIAYTKTKFDNLPIAFLNQLKEEISNGY